MRLLIQFLAVCVYGIVWPEVAYSDDAKAGKAYSGRASKGSLGAEVEAEASVGTEGDADLSIFEETEGTAGNEGETGSGDGPDLPTEATSEAVPQEGAGDGATAAASAAPNDAISLSITPAPETPWEQRERLLAERRAEREARYAAMRAAWEKRRAAIRAERERYWKSHQHPPFYFNWMPFGGAVIEDRDNRLTARDDRVLEGVGVAIRLGGIVDDKHMLGVRIQGWTRPTQMALHADGQEVDEWGAVVVPFIGPEYRFLTRFGLYVGGTIGAAGVISATGDDCDDDCREDDSCDMYDCDDADTRGVVSIGFIGSLGYQFRVRHYFAMNVELFGGFLHGFDMSDGEMNNALFGVGFGFGI